MGRAIRKEFVRNEEASRTLAAITVVRGRLADRLTTFNAIAIFLCLWVAVAPAALANPQGGTIVSGEVTIEATDADTLTVRQHSNRAIVNWQSFSIDQSEHTQFLQPSSDALIVNRVIGGDASEILGKLSANGRVMLLNPNGVLFGRDAQVDVNGLIASTLGLTNDQILSERFSFSALPEGAGHILNLGSISASDQGLVALIAPSVRNDGVISARLGSVAMIAGDAVTLDTYGDGLVQFQIDQSAVGSLFDLNGDPLDSQLTNAGSITADGGLVLLNAHALQGVVDSSINMTGLVQARAVGQEGGDIVLHGGSEGTVLVSGTLDASGAGSGESGGKISVFSDRVAALDGARLDASGAAGGGTILFGGDYQGQGADNATRNYVGEGAVFTADALASGDGGRIIVWSDENTAFYGNLTARGGQAAGDGGFAEISGKENLAYAGAVDLSAANGRGGQILFDPKNIEISLLGAATLSLNDLFSDFASLSVTITPVDILALLSIGTDVVLQANNDLTVTDGLTVNNALGAGGNITLQAGRHITLNADILSDDGNISITAGDTAGDAGNRDAGIAALTMADGVSLNAGSGDITLIMGDSNGGAINLESLTTTGDVLVRNEGNSGNADILRVSADALISAGSLAMVTTEAEAVIGGSGTPVRVNVDNLEVQLLGTGGGVFLNSPLKGLNIGGAGMGGLVGFDLDGDVDLTLAGALTQSERIRNGGLITLDAGIANNVTLSNASNDFASIGIDAAADVTLFDVNGIDLAQSTVSGALNATASGNITDNGAIVVSGAATLSAGVANNITLDNAANNFASVNVSAAANVDIVDTNAIDLGSISANGNLSVTAAGAISDSGALAINGNAIIAAGAGNNVTLNSATNDFSTVLINSANDVVLVDANGMNLGASAVSGGLAITADGAVTDSGALSVVGTTSISAGAANNVTLDTAGNDFATVQIGSANTVALVDTDDVDLGASTISGGLTITADGAVTDSGAVVVSGLAAITAGVGNSVSFDTAGGDFATVQIGSAGTVSFVDTNDIIFGNSTISGGLTVSANGAIQVAGVLETNGATALVADADADGFGDFTLQGGASLGTNGNSLVVQANDFILSGAIDASGASVTIGASDGGSIGLGDAAGDLALSNAELARISASGTTFGGTTSGSIAVDGVTQVASGGLGTVTLDASQGAKTIVIDGSASIFDGLDASASNGVRVEADVTTRVAGLSIDGDADSAVDGTDSIVLGAALTSARDLTLTAQNGDIVLTSDSVLTAQAGNVVVNDAMDGGFDLTVSASGGIIFAAPVGSGTTLDTVVLQGATATGEIHANVVQIDAGTATMTGSVGGQGGAAGAALVQNTGSSSISFNAVTVSANAAASNGRSASETRVVETGHRSGSDAEPSENNQVVIESGEELAQGGASVCETEDDPSIAKVNLIKDPSRIVLLQPQGVSNQQFEKCDVDNANRPSVAQLP